MIGCTSRRQFLIGGLKVSAAAPLVAGLGRATRFAGRGGGRALVVLQLTGGNDGLNTVVPHEQDDYYRLRPTLGLARGSLHALDEHHGLHPGLAGLGELFADGRVATLHGVGLPAPDRSHFRSMEVWHTAAPEGPPQDVGWLGKLADQIAAREPTAMAALHVGAEDLPLALRGRRAFPPTVEDPNGFRLQEGSERWAASRSALLEGQAGGELAFLRAAAETTYRAAERMSALSERAAPIEYPEHELARRLRLIARLITGEFGTRVFHVQLGGFDTHARQAPLHAALLQQLSTALAAFQADLRHHDAEDRVTTLVFSEFGRRAAENGSRGTDHGAGAPVFLVGGRVRGGMHGAPPDLGRLVDGDVPATTDFRALYASLERDWMGLDPSTAIEPLALFA
jgi:uncharacterized protein (DUF1501 family)